MDELHYAGGSARQEMIIANHNCADIHGMECVHVLNRVNQINNRFIIKVLWQRKLAENAVNFIILIQFTNKRVELVLRCIGRKRIFFTVKAAFLAGLFLISYINLGVSVFDNNNNSEPWCNSLCLERLTLCLYLLFLSL